MRKNFVTVTRRIPFVTVTSPKLAMINYIIFVAKVTTNLKDTVTEKRN